MYCKLQDLPYTVYLNRVSFVQTLLEWLPGASFALVTQEPRFDVDTPNEATFDSRHTRNEKWESTSRVRLDNKWNRTAFMEGETFIVPC